MKFILLAHQRSGSTLLVSALAKHTSLTVVVDEPLNPRLLSSEEMLNVKYRDNIKYRDDTEGGPLNDLCFTEKEVLNRLGSIFSNYNGLKILYHQIPIKYKEVWQHVNKEFKIIHLTRRNWLDTVISHFVVSNTKIWHVNQNERINDKKFYLPSFYLLNSFYYLENNISYFNYVFPDALKIEYENLISNWNETIKTIEDFLEIPQEDLPITYGKRITTPKEDLIINYDELKRTFMKTRFKEYFQGFNVPLL